jgi:flagellar biosynthetic protein FlhB
MEDRGSSSDEDKTEEATEEKRKQFREQGNIANPREIVSAVALSVMFFLLSLSGAKIVALLLELFRKSWTGFRPENLENGRFLEIAFAAVAPIFPTLGIASLILVAIPASIGLMLTKFNWSSKALAFKFEKLDPIAGTMRMFGAQSATELIKSIMKLLFYGTAAYFALRSEVFHIMRTGLSSPETVVFTLGNSLNRLVMALIIAAAFIGIGDFGFSWWKIERQMKMTKKEIKDEVKSQEGDPHVKGQRRRMARDLVLRKTVQQVPTATFVVTNPTHFSVAVRYLKGMNAPIVVAKGQDFLALKIREIAKEHDIVLVENRALARTLYKTVKVGEEVPSSLYSSIIEVMKFIYQTRGRNYFDRSGLSQTVGE